MSMVDYHTFNRVTKPIKTPALHMDEMLNHLGHKSYLSKLDLKARFHQIQIDLDDVEKTACKTKYCHFEFLVM